MGAHLKIEGDQSLYQVSINLVRYMAEKSVYDFSAWNKGADNLIGTLWLAIFHQLIWAYERGDPPY